jgi:hypothetical protein
MLKLFQSVWKLGYVNVIKRNLAEIMAVAGWDGGQSRGMDSVNTGDIRDWCGLAQSLALQEGIFLTPNSHANEREYCCDQSLRRTILSVMEFLR